MSKIDTIREKYNIPLRSFNRFVDADYTPTKKYLEYMVKMWKENIHIISSVGTLIEQVHKFDSLLPYIPLKDIYHKEYTNFHFLIAMNEKAEEIKEEKTFVREDHCDILIECDEYILLRPKTFRGSLKYGYGTKWCTASRTNESTFDRYYNNGTLAYLIDKTQNRGHLNKIAIYIEHKEPGLSGDITLYDPKDKEIIDTDIISQGWREHEFLNIIMTFRYFAHKIREKRKSLDFINNFQKTMTKLDFVELENHIKNVNDGINLGFLSNLKDEINKFKEKIKNYGN